MLAEYVEKCSLIDKTINVVWVRVVALYETTILALLKRSLYHLYSTLFPTDRPSCTRQMTDLFYRQTCF